MEKKIAVKDAQVKTVSVEIKSLSVNNKQMTLSMFRQIPLDEHYCRIIWSAAHTSTPYAGELAFDGVLWGWVNYHPDASCRRSTHKHLVYVNDGELKRGTYSGSQFRHKVLKGTVYNGQWWGYKTVNLYEEISTNNADFDDDFLESIWDLMSMISEAPQLYIAV